MLLRKRDIIRLHQFYCDLRAMRNQYFLFEAHCNFAMLISQM